jgi:hypothetical protein
VMPLEYVPQTTSLTKLEKSECIGLLIMRYVVFIKYTSLSPVVKSPLPAAGESSHSERM